MKKINFKSPRYILPLLAFIPLLFLVYNVVGLFSGNSTSDTATVKDSINTSLPDADTSELEGKLAEMDKGLWSDDNYTAINDLEEEAAERNETSQGYTEEELDAIDREKARRAQEAKREAEMNRRLDQSRKHVNSSPTQYDEIESYADALEEIQSRNNKRNRKYSADHSEEEPESYIPPVIPSAPVKEEPQPELVVKAKSSGAEKFHTLTTSAKSNDAALIKAMIDQTTKARNGTRLRFKLLDDVIIKGITVKKGTYLYGTVTGFIDQRVTASITSLLLNDKFIKVNLSVYDNDGMEGFYVPASLFRSFVKDASSNAVGGMQINGGNNSAALTGEAVALQALQNLYSSATSAVSNNLRQDKAKIKYNTIVYLINTNND